MKANWNGLAANILKAELKRKGFTYDQLQQKLLTLGVNETTNGIKVKLSRGAFQFAFFLQCAAAIGLKKLSLDELNSHESE
ncbi:TPA: hypothetical protein JBF46_16035 [Legionella pneumophila]|uniref:DUF6471 domain-containing protein n=1 Tax=Legionella pneumophila TaxID=446 RepID=UPI0007707530|nr:DUF6471 domain-containing protein [Legionella pneumophila]PQM70084.1 hypothetical protein C3926_16645 [Legionella pneumophila]CZL45145.1 Uncharacterised protein [Legionella pneumophila]HAU0301655.1 hypothetical protein [Legionella pneumophila]HCU6007753.1 hypothetical protein [Legionella pneumophila]